MNELCEVLFDIVSCYEFVLLDDVLFEEKEWWDINLLGDSRIEFGYIFN